MPSQAIQCLKAGKHVQVEIPLADSLKDAEAVLKAQQETGLIAMCGHTRRFNPSHQWVRKKIAAGELKVLQMDVQTYFFRRTNMNALGKPRSWTDHLLWHHAAHTVDLFQYQTGEEASRGARRARAAPSGSEDRDGHEHPAEDAEGRRLHAVAVVQQRGAAGHLLPLHLRQRHATSAATTICSTARTSRSMSRRWMSR